MASRQRDLVLAARSHRRRARRQPATLGISRRRVGFRRGPLDRRGRDRGSGARQRAVGVALRPVPQPRRAQHGRQAALGDAPRFRRPRRAGWRQMTPRESHDVAHASATRAPSFTLVIFGAGGDLTKRLVVPALYNLLKTGLLPDKFAIVGVDHNERSSEDWRNGLHDFVENAVKRKGSEFHPGAIDEQVWKQLAGAMTYLTGDFLEPDTYKKLGAHLAELDRTQGLGGRVLFYLAVAERFFGAIVDRLGAAGLTREQGDAWRRVIIEKTLREDQIYRIDHFLGKETVQNIMALRFANGLFEPIWNRDRIDHVEIAVTETVGVETRARFYEPTGALRDMVPNHLFQVL